MAYVGGRTSYLPGQKIFLPINTCCDEHTEVHAVARIVTETDSFGFEAIDVCQECYDNYKAQDTPLEGVCEWCKSSDKDLKYKRDPDEGTSGRVYMVCVSCIKSLSQRLQADADEYNSNQDDDYYPSEYPEDLSEDDTSDKTD